MSRPVYPSTRLLTGVTAPWKSVNYSASKVVDYVVVSEDVLSWLGFPYEYLAQKLYGDRGLWWVIYDQNATIPPDALTIGVVIQLPVISPADFVQPITSGR